MRPTGTPPHSLWMPRAGVRNGCARASLRASLRDCPPPPAKPGALRYVCTSVCIPAHLSLLWSSSHLALTRNTARVLSLLLVRVVQASPPRNPTRSSSRSCRPHRAAAGNGRASLGSSGTCVPRYVLTVIHVSRVRSLRNGQVWTPANPENREHSKQVSEVAHAPSASVGRLLFR